MKKLFTLIAALFLTFVVKAASTPEYPGGQQALDAYIASNMKYPETAKANGIEGAVDVAFTVKADGSIGTIKIVRMLDPDLEAEAIRLVKSMPKWTPADNNGTPVDAQTQIQINFVLD